MLLNPAHSQAMQDIMTLLGLPKHTTAFTLHVNASEIPTVSCTYVVQEPSVTRSGPVTRRFELYMLDEDPSTDRRQVQRDGDN